MLAQVDGKHVFECDICEELLDTNTTDLAEALKIMQRANWRERPVGLTLMHTCFGCEQESAATRGRRTGRARRK